MCKLLTSLDAHTEVGVYLYCMCTSIHGNHANSGARNFQGVRVSIQASSIALKSLLENHEVARLESNVSM